MADKFNVIISHGFGCADGAVSAWCAWRTLSNEYKQKLAKHEGFYSDGTGEFVYDNKWVNPASIEGALKLQREGFSTVFAFAQPGTKIPQELIKNKSVLILDLDLGNELVNVVNHASSVCLVDHHQTSETTLLENAEALDTPKLTKIVNIAPSESGASLTWKLFNGDSEPLPPLINVVRIDDTWSWQDLPELNSKAVIRSLKCNNLLSTFYKIEHVFNTWDVNFDKWSTEGNNYLFADNINVKLMAKSCDLGYVKSKDGTVYTVAFTQAPVLISEVGSAIRKYAELRFKCKIDFCVTWKYLSYKDLVLCSARSPREGLDLGNTVRNLENINGGGGHPQAAGFNFNGLENFKNVIMKTPPSLEVVPPIKTSFWFNLIRYTGISFFLGKIGYN